MWNRSTILAVAAVVAVATAGIGYEILTSQAPPANSCPATTTTSAGGGLSNRALASPTRTADPTSLRPAGEFPPPNPLTLEPRPSGARSTGAGTVVRVVAAENFWGSLVSQVGGNATNVVSVVSDPNIDPHEYEANATDATLIANAQFVIVNGVGYDQWALDLIAAANTKGQVVLNVGDLNGVVLGGGIVAGNPHMWYNPTYVHRTVAAIYSDLVQVAPGDATTFQANYAALNASLGSLYAEADAIHRAFAGTVVAATEDIFVYLANYTGLNLVSPPAFMEAVAEGSDPPAPSIVAFQCQLESGQVRVLVYNEQTVTPLTTSLRAIAAEHNVTIVGITETIQPPQLTFQAWMGAEYVALDNALNGKALAG